jgi:hypothetical protein
MTFIIYSSLWQRDDTIVSWYLYWLHAAALGLGSSGGRGCPPVMITAALKFRGMDIQFVEAAPDRDS